MIDNTEDLEKAFNKELFIIKNDLYYQQLELDRNGKKELLRIDISYKPHSSLSGDSYSLRKTKDGRLVGFVVDAMGKGTSAALTSMGATRFLNYFFDELEDEGTFSFELWIKKFVKFMKKNILDDETLSIAFMEFDLVHSKLHYALFGMPAFLVVTLENELKVIKSNNAPLMIYTDDVHINTLDSALFSKMLCYTDGLSESFTKENVLYGSLMREDFVNSPGIEDFNERVRQNIGKGDDDLTYIYVKKLETRKNFETLHVKSNYEGIEEALHRIFAYLKKYELPTKCSSEVSLALSELLLNALEHGSFGINTQQKNLLIEQNIFEQEMERLAQNNQHKTIEIHYGIVPSGNRQLFEATISDMGEGFDTRILKNIVINAENFNGRGLIIVKKLLDHFYFNEKGNAITIQKFLQL